MDRGEAGIESTRTTFMKLMIVVVFVSLITSFIFYLNESEPDIKLVSMEGLAEQFSRSVNNAHWKWQADGRPDIVIVIDYENRMDESMTLIEKDRRAIQMSHLGWPRVEPTSDGCDKLWDMVLNVRMEVEGFRVYGEYYDGVAKTGNALDATCRFRMSVGPYFDYRIYTGQVGPVEKG